MSVEEWELKYSAARISFFTSEACYWLIGTKWMEILAATGLVLYLYGWHEKVGVVLVILAGYILAKREGLYEGYCDGFVNSIGDPQGEWSDEDRKEWSPVIKKGRRKCVGIFLYRPLLKK